MDQTTSSPRRPVVALITDFGLSDGYIGVIKGVIAANAPEAHIIDITHDIAPQNIFSAAWILASVYRYFPKSAPPAPGTVFVCVVDPGVGSARRAIAMHAGNWFFIGPDNGLFSYVLAEQPVHAACILSNPTYHLTQVSSTFHGRDIFAPVAAHLARGIPLSELGTQIDPATLQRIDLHPPTQHEDSIDARIVHIDHFGNLISNIPFTMIPDLFSHHQVRILFQNSGIEVSHLRRFFAEGSDDAQPFIYVDSSGYIGIAVRNGHAARILSVDYGTPITLYSS